MLLRKQYVIIKVSRHMYAARIVLIIIFLALAGPLISVHNLSNLEGRWFYKDETTVSDAVELIQFITDQKKASAAMNFQEVAIWIVLPWSFITGALSLCRGGKALLRTLILSVSSLVIMFSLASITNRIGVNRELAEELPVWESKFKLIEDPIIKEYGIEDAATAFDSGHYGKISIFAPDGSMESFIYFGIPDGTIREYY